jgi:hypothetical protein
VVFEWYSRFKAGRVSVEDHERSGRPSTSKIAENVTSLKTTEFLTNNNIVIVPHPPYSPDLVPCDFALFPKLKMKLKGRRFETVPGIQRESKAVLDSIKENDFYGSFEAWKNIPKETILKEIAAKIE